ncbi:hypothetical protein CDL15_Pgr023883 [Punica granatum]|uniref:xyloglucan:xyloglucosyl transferase n=1 Tax=Punica granatum TaxID=22663 RepID=A0A218XVG6_PUNGR|nr:hypothetical protein CDL15_Pgr023883 [Punica granatum]
MIPTRVGAIKLGRTQRTERISGSAGDVLEDDPVGRLKVFVYELPSKYNKKILQKDPRCLTHMFAAEIFMHRFLLSSPVRTLNPEEADWFYTPVYTTCDLTPNGLPLPFKSPRMMRSAIQLISSNWPYWNRTEGADHFFVVPHDFGACFHYQEEKAIERGILSLLQRATLVQTFGQKNHVCLKEGSITIPPYAPPQKMQTHLIPEKTPRSIFVYFRGLFYDVGNDPEGGYYARGARAAVWENFKDNPLFDISTEHPTTYYEDMQRAVFCLCPLGWAPWSPRLVEAVIFGCIPVIIADDIVLPFADAIPWEEIGVFVDEKDVPNLDTILTSIPVEVILRKQRLLANPSMKQAMLFPQPAQPGDAFHQVLNGLARKLPHDRVAVYLKPANHGEEYYRAPAVLEVLVKYYLLKSVAASSTSYVSGCAFLESTISGVRSVFSTRNLECDPRKENRLKKGPMWDEIDLEFLGNLSGDPYILQTNVLSQGKGNREQQFYLWFDQTADFHTYSILWNPQHIMNFNDYNAWVWSSATSTSSCSSTSGTSGSNNPWLSEELDKNSQDRLRWVLKNYMIYNYFVDSKRFLHGLPMECTMD